MRARSGATRALLVVFEEGEIDEEHCADHCGLEAHVKVEWEVHAEVVSIGEVFPHEARPLFTNFAHLLGFVGTQHLELLLARAERPFADAHRPVDMEHHLVCVVADFVRWLKEEDDSDRTQRFTQII